MNSLFIIGFIANTVSLIKANPKLLMTVSKMALETDRILYNNSIACPDSGLYYVPDEFNCSKLYECGNGNIMGILHCSEGTTFSYMLQGCASPELAQCNSSEPSKDSASSTELANNESFKNGCPKDFNIKRNFEHEASCRLFYQCVNGEKILQKCDQSTIFNIEVEGCEEYFNGNCERLMPIASNKIPKVTKTLKPDFEANENGCPIDARIKWLIPHKDCNKFYICVFGHLAESVCPMSGTHYNPKLQVCGDPLTAGCANATCPDGEDCSSFTRYKHSELFDMSNHYSYEDIKCSKSSQVLPFPHEDCDKFYICKGNKAQLRICSEGLYFNRITYTCDFLEKVNCNKVNYRVSPRKEGLNIYIPWFKLWKMVKQVLIR